MKDNPRSKMILLGADSWQDKGKRQLLTNTICKWGFPCGSVVKNSPANAGNVGSVPGWGRCPGEGNGYPLQYSCLEPHRQRGPWQATVQRLQTVMLVTKQKVQQPLCKYSRYWIWEWVAREWCSSKYHRQKWSKRRQTFLCMEARPDLRKQNWI